MKNFVPKIGLVSSLGLFCLWGLSFLALADSAKTISIVKPDLLLLSSLKQNEDVSGWLMSEKLDGVRAYWNGQSLISRGGIIFNAPEWFTKNFPSYELDGELWINRQRFAETVSIVRKRKPHEGWRQITYNIFEVPHQQGGLLDRLETLRFYLQQHPSPYLQIIPQTSISSFSEVESQLKEVVSLGGEGLVLREPNAPYYTGRSPHSVKVKQKQDAECTVIGYTAGKGKYTGKVGALKCQMISESGNSSNQALLELKIGSGLTDEQRQNPPKVGSIVTFQYMGFTKSGLPRFPVFLRVRSDADLSIYSAR